jgi:hypothetical protein
MLLTMCQELSKSVWNTFNLHTNHLTEEEFEAQRGYGFCSPNFIRTKICILAICSRVYPLHHYAFHKSFTGSKFHFHLFIHLSKNNLMRSSMSKGRFRTLRLEGKQNRSCPRPGGAHSITKKGRHWPDNFNCGWDFFDPFTHALLLFYFSFLSPPPPPLC